jgi:phage/plasmid-like protein (TIGR03299 family)
MSANVETCFLFKQPAWYGLGVVVQEAPTSIDALRLAQLDWDVVPEPVFLKDGSEVPETVVNIRSSDHSILGIVSDHYKIVQNREAFSFIDGLLESDIEKVTFESAGALNHGKRVWMLAHLPAKKILGDDIVPYLVFTNSHDGTSAITAAMSPVRVVCANTLALALNTAKRTWSIRHMGNIEGKKKDAAMTLGLAAKYMEQLEVKAEDYQQKKVSKEMLQEIIDLAFPLDEDEKSDRVKNNVHELRNQFIDICIGKDDLKKFTGTAWGVYNAFGDFATHIKPLRETKNFRENLFASFIDGNKMLKLGQEAIEKVCA